MGQMTEDGAPAGAEQPRRPGDRYAYNADARAKAREDAPITIGGQEFHRRRKSWEVTRELRQLLRAQEKASSRAERFRAQIDALTEKIRGVRDPDTGDWVKYPLTDEDEVAELEGKVDDLNDKVDEAILEGDNAAFEMIALLLRKENGDEAGGDRPDVEHLKRELDAEEAGELAAVLASGAEPLEDPTQTGTSSDS